MLEPTTTQMELVNNGIAEAAAHAISSCTTNHEFQKDGVVGAIALSVADCLGGDDRPEWTQIVYLE